MNAFAHPDATLLLPVLASLLIPRLIALVALAMVLRGSQPDQRPALLDACTQFLRDLLRPSFRPNPHQFRDSPQNPPAAQHPGSLAPQTPPDTR